MREIGIFSNKGSYKLKSGFEVVDLIHDASVFRGRSDQAERIEVERGYGLINGVIPTAGIIRVINKETKDAEDYLITYPFFEVKPNVNLFGLGKHKVEEEEDIDNVEYDELIELKGESANDIVVGGGVSGEQLKKAYERLKEEKDFYPELWEMVKDFDEENIDTNLLRMAFIKYAEKNGVQGIKDLRSLGVQIKSVKDLKAGYSFDMILDLLQSNYFSDTDLGEYQIQFLPTNLILTGVIYQPSQRKFIGGIIFQPERIPLEPARSIARIINSQNPLYSARQVVLKILSPKRMFFLKQGKEEDIEKNVEILEKLKETFPQAKEWIEKVQKLLKGKEWDKLEKELKRAYVENRKIYEEAILKKPLVQIGKILKQGANGKWFLSNPLANRGYSLKFTKKLYEVLRYEGEGSLPKAVMGMFTPLPRVVIENNELKLKKVYKPIAIIKSNYDEETLEPLDMVILKSKPEYIFAKWDRRIAGAIEKRSEKALNELKREITSDKSVAGIYTKLIDEALKQIAEGGELKGVVKDYIEAVKETKEQLRKLYATLKDEKVLTTNMEKFVHYKYLAEEVDTSEILSEVLREFKKLYWDMVGAKKAFLKNAFKSITKAKEEIPKERKEEVAPDVIDIDEESSVQTETKMELSEEEAKEIEKVFNNLELTEEEQKIVEQSKPKPKGKFLK